MANNYLLAAFTIPVTSAEAALLQECFEVAAELSSDFASIPHEELEAARFLYGQRSEAFKAAFPARDGEADPFAGFFALWSDPDFPDFDASLSVSEAADQTNMIAFIQGEQVDVDAVACLIQKVCTSALPFGFEWATTCDKMRSGEFGGGYLVITDTEIRGGSTGWLMRQNLQNLKAVP